MRIMFPKRAGSYAKGRVIDVDRATGAILLRIGKAVEVDSSTPARIKEVVTESPLNRSMQQGTLHVSAAETEDTTLSRRARRRLQLAGDSRKDVP